MSSTWNWDWVVGMLPGGPPTWCTPPGCGSTSEGSKHTRENTSIGCEKCLANFEVLYNVDTHSSWQSRYKKIIVFGTWPHHQKPTLTSLKISGMQLPFGAESWWSFFAFSTLPRSLLTVISYTMQVYTHTHTHVNTYLAIQLNSVVALPIFPMKGACTILLLQTAGWAKISITPQSINQEKQQVSWEHFAWVYVKSLRVWKVDFTRECKVDL